MVIVCKNKLYPANNAFLIDRNGHTTRILAEKKICTVFFEIEKQSML